ncbi:hypothetical protein DICPUDRAFT_83441 [Dictyostelium purpureum]|uniref:Poly [ADP-ribose] polymerase n=1 Tax=Dictyostelium purpureum TaxID=5786 RepID=F0ZZJ7_DICPU|nr:uncharacterized protein DICPUDRAFT_83441 [Dictyostelium purpureum]EGC30636.1 hypothetical protein DICPUDRAFT_83441 [Dictyostelium purpureum]|eukprot:XP_003292842.1 hypothetical protein DICPUDRAFT_83441 [Dictyostelium purpureum]
MFQRGIYPTKWKETTEEVSLVEINKEDSEYSQVKERFDETLSNDFKIEKIERVQNKSIWRSYYSSLEDYKTKYNNVNENFLESTLFHGTRGNDPTMVYKNDIGFDIKNSSDGSFGVGLYFSENASNSLSFSHELPNGQFQFFLCRVILGNGSNVSNQDLIECQDSIKKDGIYVLKENNRSYPDYLITYSKKESANNNKLPNTKTTTRANKKKENNKNKNDKNKNNDSDDNINDEERELQLALSLSMPEHDEDYELALALQLSAQDYTGENKNKDDITTTTTTTTTEIDNPYKKTTTTTSNTNSTANFENSEEYDDYELALALEISKAESNINTWTNKKRNNSNDENNDSGNESKKKKKKN